MIISFETLEHDFTYLILIEHANSTSKKNVFIYYHLVLVKVSQQLFHEKYLGEKSNYSLNVS